MKKEIMIISIFVFIISLFAIGFVYANCDVTDTSLCSKSCQVNGDCKLTSCNCLNKNELVTNVNNLALLCVDMGACVCENGKCKGSKEVGQAVCGNGVCELGEDVKNICPTCQDSEDCPCRMNCPQDCDKTVMCYYDECKVYPCPKGAVKLVELSCSDPKCNTGSCVNDSNNQVGNDTDSHGCIGSAGYSWCEEKQKCLRSLGENCLDIKLPGEGKVKILPEAASQRAREMLGELGFNVTLKEVGNGNQTKSYYKVSGEKEGKMLGLFKIKGKVSVDVDAETGEVIKVHKPWWAFLASGI
jgi:hypothetical protein